MSRFEGKVAIVTGAASGMGKASAIRLAEEGAKVVLGDVNEEGLQQTAADIDAAGGVAKAVTFNAMEEASCKALVASAVDTFGQLDVVVNAAGIGGFYRLDELSVLCKWFDRVFVCLDCTCCFHPKPGPVFGWFSQSPYQHIIGHHRPAIPEPYFHGKYRTITGKNRGTE